MNILPKFALFTVLATASVSLLGQSATDGALVGVVHDSSEAAIPSASVTVVDENTQSILQITADKNGTFQARGLRPGSYKISVAASGFATYEVNHVTVSVGVTSEIGPTLGIAGSTSTVQVMASTPPIDTESAAASFNVDKAQVSNLPINGRRWSNFVTLTPGTVRDGQYGLISFRGMSGLQNNNTVDGADNNDAFWSEERGRSIRIGYSTPQAAIQEFQVNTSDYSAAYGRAAGGVINTVTKSGTNNFHGELYLFDRDNRWGAINPFTTLSQSANGVLTTTPYKPIDRRKQVGFGIGGPLLQDRLFVFYAFDYYQRNFPATAVVGSSKTFFAAPTSAQLTLLAQRLNTTTANAQQLYNTGLTDLSSVLGTSPRHGSQTLNFPKLDWQVAQNTRASFQYNRMLWNSPGDAIPTPTYQYGTHSSGGDVVKVNWGLFRLASAPSPSLLNVFLFQYGRDLETAPLPAPATYEQTFASPQFGIPASVAVAGTNGFTFGPWPLLPRDPYPDERRTQVADTTTWQKTHHTLAAGIDFNHVADASNNLNYKFGDFIYTTVLNYLSDYYAFRQGSGGTCNAAGTGTGSLPCYASFLQGLGNSAFAISTNVYSGFVNDIWRPRTNLTITLGLRYDYEQYPGPINSISNPKLAQTQNQPSDADNVAPRLGFSWKPFRSGATVLRGGYGFYYGLVSSGNLFAARTSTGSSNAQRNYLFLASQVGAPVFPNVLATTPTNVAAKPTASYVAADLKTPLVQQTNLFIDQRLSSNTELSVGYVGSFGRRLPSIIDTNVDTANVNTVTYNVVDASGNGPIKTPTYSTTFYSRRLNTSYGQTLALSSSAASNYNALYIDVRRAMAHHLQFDANYVWSHAIDDGQSENTVVFLYQLQIPRNVKADWANSTLNFPNRFVTSLTGTSPWNSHGWAEYVLNDFSLSTILQAQSGFPYSLSTTGTATAPASSGAATALGAGVNGSGGAASLPDYGRNTYRTSPAVNMDLRLSKSVRFKDRVSLEILGEAFNLFNHQNVTSVNTTAYVISGNTLTYNVDTAQHPLFGSVTGAGNTQAFTQRQVQLGARILF